MKIFFKRPIYERFCFVFTLLLMPVFSTFPQQYLDQQEQPINGNSYWRVTRSITQNEISRSVFAEQAASEWVRVLNWNNSLDFAVRLTVDPVWDRIIFSEYNEWIKSYGDHPGEKHFINPHGICRSTRVIPDNNNPNTNFTVRLYVADSGNDRVLELPLTVWEDGSDHEGTIWYQREFNGSNSSFGTLNYPFDVAYQTDPNSSHPVDDFLWVTDTRNHRVVKIRLGDGQIVDAFGSSGSGYDNFTYPTYLAVDSRNDRAYIFVVDAGNYRIIKLRHDANGTRRVNSYSYSGDWVINGIECDKFGHLWLTDQNNHQIIRMNSLMELVFSDCSYGTGQTPGILNQPIDIDMDYKTVLNYQGVPQQNWYFDLLFATEKWSNNSGQVYYQTRPKKVQNSFSYQAVFEVPQDDDEIQLESLQHSEPNSADPPVEAVLKTWLGTNFWLTITDMAYVTATIYNENNNLIWRHLWDNKLKGPGEISLSWNGEDDNGDKVSASNIAYLHITLQSVYSSNSPITYVLDFYPSCSDCGSSTAPLMKLSSEEENIQTFEVFPNYPNPFNSATHIPYQLPEKGKVKIEIYNILGQKVKTVLDRDQEKGAYTIEWNGTNDHGVIVGSGVYFYHIIYHNNDKRKTVNKKLLMIK